MSVFHKHNLPCPACGKDVAFSICHSINVDRKAVLRDEILAGTFQRETCGACGEEFRMEPEFTYLDLGRGLWLAAKPREAIAQWQTVEGEVQEIYDRAFGKQAPPSARKLAKGVRARLVFGWCALTEKIAINHHGLDDAAIEIVKVGLLRNLPGNPLSSDSELRFVFEAKDGDELQFAWFTSSTGKFLQAIRIPKSLYDHIAGNPFEPLRPQVGSGLFVDMQRLYVQSR